MMNLRNFFRWSLVVTFITFFAFCSKSEDGPAVNQFDISFVLPSSIDVSKGGEFSLVVNDGKTPDLSDSFILESNKGISFLCSLVKVSSAEFTVKLPVDLETGYYKVYVKRDTRKKSFGSVYINLVEQIDFVPEEGTTLYGVVSSGDGIVKNAVVSDGIEVAITNDKGIYQLKSKKDKGYVFISIPGNYEVPSKGVLPQFYQKLKSDANTLERVDFNLNKVAGQDNYKVFFLGDMHLANRNSDLSQFSEFASDLNKYRSSILNQRAYAITLGDMTWDLYWYSNIFSFSEYLTTMNNQFKNLQVFHTMGNHDNDYKALSENAAQLPYQNYIAPSYYSFNIGKVHYVVMDDIDCSNYDGTTSRNYVKRLSSEQLAWLAKDLLYVDKNTPLVIMMHAQVFYPLENGTFKYDHDATSTSQLMNIVDGYQVHFVTGHTHLSFNVTPQSAIVNGKNIYEHNAGSVCASWWWSGKLSPGVHVSLDGTPGGYSIWNVSGTTMDWIYKATGWGEDYQFRTYDLNNVHFSLSDVPLMPNAGSVKDSYMRYVNAYPTNSNNEVLINIWNWNSNWSLKVVDEKGRELTPQMTWAYDPLHIAALSVKRFNTAGLTAVPSFVTEKFTHFFKVKLDDADTDLDITVKDEFGHTWTEKMMRPKVFSIDTYKSK